jgi:tRNA A37 threonylcarbamoyladenosine dehydratase
MSGFPRGCDHCLPSIEIELLGKKVEAFGVIRIGAEVADVKDSVIVHEHAVDVVLVVQGRMVISGRIFWRSRWLVLANTISDSADLETWPGGYRPAPQPIERDRAARLAGAFGEQALRRLRGSSVAVIGASGTGSPAIEVLARAGVGRLVIVDPDTLERSNLERVHGSYPEDVAKGMTKVAVAARHVRAIDPSIHVEALCGRLPQKEVIDAVVTADVALGCTDQQHSRLALSDVAFRYLVPALDCGVVLEGKDGRVTGQVAQLVRFRPADACALCREMIVADRIKQELMSDEEKTQRREAAQQALRRGDNPNAYWRDQPQINTVGYLTTTVGGMLAGYAIGWLTKRFDTPFARLQMNFVAPFLDVTDVPQRQRAECACARFRGWADQGNADALITAPDHWPEVQRLQSS